MNLFNGLIMNDKEELEIILNEWSGSQKGLVETNVLLSKMIGQMAKGDCEFNNKVVELINEKEYTKLQHLLSQSNEDLNDKKSAQIHLLSYAIKKRDVEAIKVLMSNGANVNYLDQNALDEKKYPIILETILCDSNVLKHLLIHRKNCEKHQFKH
jgi:hypothetical protein